MLGFGPSAFLECQCEAVFSSFCVFSEVYATFTGIGIHFEYSIGPRLLGFSEFFFAVGTFSHEGHNFLYRS